MSTLKSKARQNGAVIESVKNHQLLKLYSECRGVRGNFSQSLVDVVKQSGKSRLYSDRFYRGKFISIIFENVFILYLGGIQVMSGNFSIGMLVAFISYLNNFAAAR